MQHHNDTIITTDAGRLFYKIYLSLYCMGSKRVTRGLRVRGIWKLNIDYNILTPHSYGRHVVSFLFSWCSTGGLEAHSAGWWLPLLHLISIFFCPQSPSEFPRAPSAGCGFPYHISSTSDWNSNWHWDSNSAALYNSSTPTRSLKSHV